MKIDQLASNLPGKSWVGFDLDDTLHHFRKASDKATTKTLEAISNIYGSKLPELETKYTEILTQTTSNSFTDGKTSHEYRRERFSAVLSHFLLPLEEDFLNDLVKLYEKTMMASLELIPITLEALLAAKERGCKIVVITEGPQDAQERAIEKLGIADKIDFLATTNRFGVSKTNGLFPKVIEYLGIHASDMIYIGGSEERDMVPARAAGILSMHFQLEE